MIFNVLALAVEQFFRTFIEFHTVKNTWSANVKFLHHLVTNTSR